MTEYSKKGKKKGPMPRRKKTLQHEEEDDDDDHDFEELEESNTYHLDFEQQSQKKKKMIKSHLKQELQQMQEETVQSPPSSPPRHELKEKLTKKTTRIKAISEPQDVQMVSAPRSLPSKMIHQKKTFPRHANENKSAFNGNVSPGVKSPLPPITNIENLNEIFQTKLQSYSIKDFKVNQKNKSHELVLRKGSSRIIYMNMLIILEKSIAMPIHY